MFPEVMADAAEAFCRPYGRVDIMLGMESRSLHCRDGYKVDNLRLNRSIFAPWWFLTGQVPAAVSRRKGLRVKSCSTAQRKWARRGYKSRNARKVTYSKSNNSINKGKEGERGADNYANGKLRMTTRNSDSPGGVPRGRTKLSVIIHSYSGSPLRVACHPLMQTHIQGRATLW